MQILKFSVPAGMGLFLILSPQMYPIQWGLGIFFIICGGVLLLDHKVKKLHGLKP
jgi:hypothetical protein